VLKNDPSENFVVQGRFTPAIVHLSTHQYRYAIWVDVRDVVFQSNPSTWLAGNLAPQKIVGASECWKIKSEPYNDKWVHNTFTAETAAWLCEEDVCCGGTLAGEASSVLSALTRIHTISCQSGANDQAALNYVLRTSPEKEITRIPKMREGFAVTCSAFKTRTFNSYCGRTDAVTDEFPVFEDFTVRTPKWLQPFCIVHQYDRDQKWKNGITSKYSTASQNETLMMLITTGEKYCKYLKPLIDSARKYMSGHDVMAFTDTSDDLGPNVIKVPHKHLGFPMASLMRYHTFLEQKSIIARYKNVFYMDVDCLFVRHVGSEIFSNGITAVLHPWHGFGGTSFEDRKESMAYVDLARRPTYFQGCFQGGSTAAFLEMAGVLARNTDIDLSNGIIAKYHDESHLNRYLLDHPPSKVLPTTYCFVEGQPGVPLIRHFNIH